MRVFEEWIAKWRSGPKAGRPDGANLAMRPGESGDSGDAPPPGEAPLSKPGSPRQGTPRNPWLPDGDPPEAPPSRRPGALPGALEELFFPRSGPSGGSGKPGGPRAPLRLLPPRGNGKSRALSITVSLVALWLLGTSCHQIDSTGQGLVTRGGRYARVLGPGLGFSLPWPFEQVAITDVAAIHTDALPEGDGEQLMLTADRQLVDLGFAVRWNISDLKRYTYELARPDEALRQQAEAAMHAAVGQMPLAEVMAGTGRARLEETVRARLQQELDAAHAGVAVEGVEIRKADPPARVSEAFRKVAAARQEAGADIARAQAFSQQLVARAEGEAGAFDRIYAQYRLAPEVTCRRMYYETMERVLAGSNKIIAPRGTSITLPLADPARQPAANGDQAGNPPPAARPAPQTAGTPTTGTQP